MQQLLIKRVLAFYRSAQREPLEHKLPTALRQLPGPVGIAENGQDSLRELSGIVCSDQDTGFAIDDAINQAANAGGDHRCFHQESFYRPSEIFAQ